MPVPDVNWQALSPIPATAVATSARTFVFNCSASLVIAIHDCGKPLVISKFPGRLV